MTFNPSRNSLFVGNHQGHVAEVNIPVPVNSNDIAQLPFASFVQAFYEPTGGTLAQITGSEASISGLLAFGDRLYGSASIYYDANNLQRVSHYARPKTLSAAGVVGMRQVWLDEHSGFVSGFMATVPAEWQQKLGGPAITGQCCIPIAWRTSWGPSAFAFNPADILTTAKVPAQPLLFYSSEHPTLGPWDGTAPIYNASTEIAGVALLAGTRTALYVGRTGNGPLCYGIGTSNQSIVGTMSPDGAIYCYDPVNAAKAQHNYPYTYQIWAYDLNEFAAVKAGSKNPWDVVPYGVWTFSLPFIAPETRLGGIGYDPSRQILYISQLHADQDNLEYRPIIYALKVGGGAVGAPLPAPDTTPLPPVSLTSGSTSDGTRITALTMTVNKIAPQPAGTTISFSATPTGGAAPHQYKWLVHDGLRWTEMTGWSTANTFNWTPAAPNPYRVGVWVRSAGHTADVADFVQSVDFGIGNATNWTAPYEATKSVTIAADKSAPQPAGSMITWTATAGGGQAPQQFKWLIHNGLQWTVASEWSTSRTFVWTPAVGNSGYRVGVWVRSDRGTADVGEATNSADFAITSVAGSPAPPPSSPSAGRLTAVSLTANKAAPQPAATTITFTASPTGGATPHTYKWLVHNGLQWSVASDWSTSNIFNWTPASSNAGYRIGVWVRSAGLTADTPEMSNSMDFAVTAAVAAPAPPPPPPPSSTGKLTAVSLTPNKPAPQPAGTTITLSAVPTGGAAPHQYKWLVHNGLQWNVVSDWTTSSTHNWTPAAANAATRVGVWVKSAGIAGDTPETTMSIDYPISAASAAPPPPPLPPPPPPPTGAVLSAVTLSANKAAPQPQYTTITFTAIANGGIAPLQYKWLVHDGLTWKMIGDWTTANTFNWTPAAWNSGYRFGVWVRNAGNAVDAGQVTSSMDFPISVSSAPPPNATPALTAVTLGANKIAPQFVGTPITFTAIPTGGATPHQYKWLIHNGVSWTAVTGWSTSNTFTWTPAAPNMVNRVGVWVRTAGNNSDVAEMTMSMDFPIK